METTTQILQDKGLIDSYDNAAEVVKNYLLFDRRRPDLEKVKDVIQ